jgi:hypothetical protein
MDDLDALEPINTTRIRLSGSSMKDVGNSNGASFEQYHSRSARGA